MEENKENNTAISETTDAEEAVSAANEEPQEAVPEVDHDVPDVVPKKRSVKKVLAALLDIIFVCIIAFGVMQYYADQFREQIDNIALEQARSALSDLSSMLFRLLIKSTAAIWRNSAIWWFSAERLIGMTILTLRKS